MNCKRKIINELLLRVIFFEMKDFRKFIINSLIILFLILNFSSCKISKQNISADYSALETKPMIAFLNCSILYDTISQEHKMLLISKIITEGKVKETNKHSETNEKGEFKYCMLDKNNKIISQTYIPNPLIKTIEYVDESGSLAKKDIKLDSTQFSLRISLDPEAKYISFDIHKNQLLLIDLKAEKE